MDSPVTKVRYLGSYRTGRLDEPPELLGTTNSGVGVVCYGFKTSLLFLLCCAICRKIPNPKSHSWICMFYI